MKLCKAFNQMFQNNLNVPVKIFSFTQWLTNVLKTTLQYLNFNEYYVGNSNMR